jgi:hypothetical protein
LRTAIAEPRPSRLLVPVPLDALVRYRRSRGPAWDELSLELRVTANECGVCGCPPARPSPLPSAHLVRELELWLLGLRDRYVLDRRNLAVLCRRCHRALDLFIDVYGRRLTPRACARLQGRFRRYEPAFRRLLVQRMRFLVDALAETEGA